MASRVCRSLIHPVRGRLLTSQAAAVHDVDTSSSLQPVTKVSKLGNGITVASLETYSPISHVSIVVKAGSRYESGDNLGISHLLRNMAGMGTKETTAFGLTRTVQQSGANYTCSTSREFITYQIDCLRDELDNVIGMVKNAVTMPAFKPWEIKETAASMTLDKAILKTQLPLQVFELLHYAAFRNTLGNSIYASDSMIGKFSSELLHQYVADHYTADRMAVVGIGVDHEHLQYLVGQFQCSPSSGISDAKAKYCGGEIRVEAKNDMVTAAVATEGPCLPSKDLLPACIMQMIMGTGPFVKYSTNNKISRLGKAAGSATSAPFGISCISSAYSDGGIFGFAATADKADIGKVLKAAFGEFASITKSGFSEEEISRAKNQLKAAVLMNAEDSNLVLKEMAEQLLIAGGLADITDILAQIDAVTISDVNTVSKKIINGKPSMAAVGNLSQTPYLDELYK
ncbi:cytochrome b-c1 complex subunit 2, mitochondrial isoform X2 [Octopus bimaculoides]|uniref:Peptidase M16 N-terminal domain-containing protein n=1 Tax=Octopus bimaculoides TaxID=37653 RepID=A0A0L8I6X5_OCTBM|nr:cytochrome b-c1 complex subunit 2, mitochondrial isoform X2 [Octopus bimaculoides]|eukprot:XP_014789963.1 PREDICTED: cytochrome b-c1 complex subunit 2, mitochondrial-like isoform X2 [Octopus bimaculoides]